MIASVVRVATKANHQILSNWLKRTHNPLALYGPNRREHPLIITRAGARRREIFFNTIPPIIVNLESFFIVASYANCSDGLARARIPPLPLKERCGIAHF